MAIRPLVTLPDAQLRLVSTPVEKITPEIRTLVADMFETMYDAPGIGLAAIQIGVPWRVVTLDVAKRAAGEAADAEDETDEDADGGQEQRDAQPRHPLAFINPEIVWSSDQRSVYEEGCLSIPDYYEEVERPAS